MKVMGVLPGQYVSMALTVALHNQFIDLLYACLYIMHVCLCVMSMCLCVCLCIFVLQFQFDNDLSDDEDSDFRKACRLSLLGQFYQLLMLLLLMVIVIIIITNVLLILLLLLFASGRVSVL